MHRDLERGGLSAEWTAGELERLIAGISRDLLNLPIGASVDAAITAALRHAGAAVGADRAYLFLLSNDGGIINNTHEWCVDGVDPQIDMLQNVPKSLFPWMWQQLEQEGSMRVPDVAALPPAAAAEKQMLQAQDIRSVLLVPVRSEGHVVGFTGFDAVLERRDWSDDAAALLAVLGDMVLSAVQRGRAFAELRESEERFSAVFRGSRDAVFVVSAELRVRMVNEAATRLTGYARDELSAMGMQELHFLPDREALRSHLRRVLRGDEVLWETELVRKEGSRVLTELSMRRVDIAGEAYIHMAARDVSERNRQRAAVRRAQDTMRALAESAQALLVMPKWEGVSIALRKLGLAVDASRVYACRTYQVPGGEWWLSVRHEWAAEGTIGRFDNRYWIKVSFAAAGLASRREEWERGEPLIIEDAGKLPQRDRTVFMAYGVGAFAGFPIWVGGERWGLLCYDARAPRRWEEPELGALRATADVFASVVLRNRQADALVQSETRYRSLFESSSDAILVRDPSGRVLDANRRASELTGYSRSELLRLNVSELHPPRAKDPAGQMLEPGPHSAGSARFETEFLAKSGRVFPVEISCRRIGEDSPVYQVIVRDISEQKDLQQHLLLSAEAERRSIGQELHDGLCQELKGLEIEVALLAQRLRTYGEHEASRAEAIGERLNGALRAAYALVMGLLPAGLDSETFDRALAGLGRLVEARENVAVEVNCEPGLEPADEAAANHLYRIAQEAMSNAVRHGKATQLVLEWKLDAMGVCLVVSDNGRGFPSDPSAIGGFGISVMRSRAEALGGSLEVNARKEGGVEVRCWCPLTVVMGEVDGTRRDTPAG